jgi:magnesium and cobalt transporter
LKPGNFLRRLFQREINPDDKHLNNLDSEKKDMIKGVFELSDTTVKEIMIPRIDVVFLPLGSDRESLLKTVSECEHSRVPVYRNTIDDVVGVLYVKDLLRHLIIGTELDLEKIMRKPYFVPESKRLNSLLREFKRRKVHIAIVVDEYGGTSGIVCLEDIIEEIVGDIQDEFDDEMEEIVKVSDAVFICDARVNLEYLNEQTHLGLPDQEFDTLSGFVFDLFGKIPQKYEKISYKNLDFIIQDMDGHKIISVKIIINPVKTEQEEKKDEEEPV